MTIGCLFELGIAVKILLLSIRVNLCRGNDINLYREYAKDCNGKPDHAFPEKSVGTPKLF